MHIKGFAKIKEAEIELAPLTIFSWENNSGKSYLLTLVYGLAQLRFTSRSGEALLPLVERDDLVATFFDPAGKALISDEPTFKKILKLTKEHTALLNTYINEILAAHKDQLLRSLFKRDLTIGDLALRLPHYKGMTITVTRSEELQVQQRPSFKHEITYHFIEDEEPLRFYISTPALDLTQLFEIAVDCYYQRALKRAVQGVKNQYFLPAARTGFLLAYRSILSLSLKQETY